MQSRLKMLTAYQLLLHVFTIHNCKYIIYNLLRGIKYNLKQTLKTNKIDKSTYVKQLHILLCSPTTGLPIDSEMLFPSCIEEYAKS